MNNQIFISTDGDKIGAQVGRASLSDDLDGLRELEYKIEAGNDIVAQFAQSYGGEVLSNGGDELNIIVPAEALQYIEAMRKDYEFTVGATLTVGVGSKLSEANKALHVAKIRGKNRTLMFDPQVDQEWLKAQQDANEGSATGEAKKIGEAYMTTDAKKPEQQPSDDCPACKEYDNKSLSHTDDCPMCQELDAQENADGTAGMDDCPMCQDYNNQEHNKDDCSMCQEYDAKQNSTGAPDEAQEDGFADCPECQALLAQSPEAQPNEEAAQLPPEQGMETNEQLLDAIDQSPAANGVPPYDAAQQIDDTQLPQGLASDGNKSVPENFGEAQESADSSQPGQEGETPKPDDSQPQLGSVLQDGLNDQQDSIQREKVIDMVSKALMSFKNQKDILEQIKGQSPDFYSANIQMLRCMIELCKMLGLEPKPNQASYPSPQPGAPSPEQPPAAAPAEGAAQPPQQ